MANQTLYLDSSLFAGRLRYRKREVPRVTPRGKIVHHSRQPLSDIMVLMHGSNSPVQQKHKQSGINESITKRESIVNVVDDSAENTRQLIDFSKNANDWKENNTKKISWNFRNKKFSDYVLLSMAGIVFFVGIGAAINSIIVDKKVVESVSAQSTNQDSSNENAPAIDADEKEPDTSVYSVAPDMPRYISIPTLGVHARVKQIGVGDDGKLAAPNNIFDAGWYTGSAKPGQGNGASVLDGHVSGPTKKGIFYGLNKLSVGDSIQIERGDGTKINYKVVRSDISKVDEVDMNKFMQSVTPGKHGINLISCTGKYDKQRKTYDQRVMVYAEVQS